MICKVLIIAVCAAFALRVLEYATHHRSDRENGQKHPKTMNTENTTPEPLRPAMARVLELLKSGKAYTSREICILAKVSNPTAEITRLRAYGCTVAKEMRPNPDENGAKYAYFRLIEDND